MAENRESVEPTQGVLTQVCLQCGNEYFFDRVEPPANMQCDRCGNGVFRSFYAATGPHEVMDDFREMTERDVTPEDPATDITAGDLADLNNP